MESKRALVLYSEKKQNNTNIRNDTIMISSTSLNNSEFLAMLDEEGINLPEYLEILIEKKLIQQGIIKPRSVSDVTLLARHS